MTLPNTSPVRRRSRAATQTSIAALAEPATQSTLPSICLVALDDLKLPNHALRRRNSAKIAMHAECIKAHQFNPPILAKHKGQVIHGADTLLAYRLLERSTVPVIYIENRTEAEIKALQLWLEWFEADGEWDCEAVKEAFDLIFEEQPELIGQTYWGIADIDLALHKTLTEPALNAAADEERNPPAPTATPIAQPGDLFIWSAGHRLLCGNSRFPESYTALMAEKTADLLCSDVPFGTSVANISSHHEEWKEGSGMDEAESQAFFDQFLASAKPHIKNGALGFLFIDWKGMLPLLLALRSNELKQKSLCTWDKKSAGLGSFIRNQSEHIIVVQKGSGKYTFNKKTEYNTTIWSVPGYSQFRPDREEALAAHACTKPQGLLMGILQLASKISDICLDPFCGGGSLLIAAHRLKRICYGIEIDETFVDTAIYRMHHFTGQWPIHEATGLTFAALAEERGLTLQASAEIAAVDEDR